MKRAYGSIVLGLASAFLMLVLVLNVVPARAAHTIAFSDDFEDGNADGWTVQSGNWSVATDTTRVYYGVNSTANNARTVITETGVAGSNLWTDYSLRARVKVVSGTYFGMLMVRYQDARNYYFVTLRTNGTVELRKFYNNSSAGTLGSATNVVTTGVWYTAEVQVRGLDFRVLLNDQPIITATDTFSATPYFTQGTVALGVDRSGVYFDDVQVTDLRVFTLTTVAVGDGLIQSTPAGIDCGATCSAVYDADTVVTLTAVPTTGSAFAGWIGACSGQGECVVPMTASRMVTAVFAPEAQPAMVIYKTGSGHGTVASDPAGIDCGPICYAGFAADSVITLTATADGDSIFSGWSGACTGSASTCTVTMAAARNVTASFAIQIFDLNVVRDGTGGGTVTSVPAGINCGSACSASYNINTVITLTAVPTTHSRFAGWSGGGCTGIGSCIVTLGGAQTVTATFDWITYTLTSHRIGSGAGSLSSSPAGIDNCTGESCFAVFNSGTAVTLTAAPATGSTFTGWSGACAGTGSCTTTMDAGKEITAEFSLIPYPLTIYTGGSGSGVVTSSPNGIDCGVTCSVNFDYGSVITLTAVPTTGSIFVGWLGGGCTGNGVCVMPIESSETITAVFAAAAQPMLVTYAGGNGSGSIASLPAGINCGATCYASYVTGTVVTLTATPAAGSHFLGWCGACTGTGACRVTMAGSQRVRAVFARDSAALLQDNFEAGTGQWTPVSGSWSITTDGTAVYSQSSTTVQSLAVAGSTAWTDYAIQARVKPEGGKYGMLVVRQSGGEYYLMALRTDNGKIELKKMAANGSSVGLGSVNAGIVPGVWYTATFEVVGNTLRAFVNGVPVITRTDTSATPPLTRGSVGLGALNTGVEFDDVIVTNLVPIYTLEIHHGGSGTGHVSSAPAGLDCDLHCRAELDRGSVITLTATPDAGSSFVGWMGAGCSGPGPCVIVSDASKSVTAIFAATARPNLIVYRGGTGSGVITSTPAAIDCGDGCLGDFALNTVVTLTAAPSRFSGFTGWSGACSGTGACVLTMAEAKAVTATFTYLTYPLTVIKNGNRTGTVTSNPAGLACGLTCTVTAGGFITLTAVPDPGFFFAGWSGGGCSGRGACVVAMDNAQQVTATFNFYSIHLPIVAGNVAVVNLSPIYVAPTGNDQNSGTITAPLKTLNRALALIQPGRTVYLRGGEYFYSETFTLTQSANAVNRYRIWAYPGETPVLDFSGAAFGMRGFAILGNYWHIKGLEIKNAPDNAIKIEGNMNIVENCVFHHNQDTGLQIGLETTSVNPTGNIAAYNEIINCDSYRNFDVATNGSNADGFACKLNSGKGNVFRGCRAWENSDDGWDMFITNFPIVVEDSWTWHNGDRTLFGSPAAWGGNGNGFKVGGNANNGAHILRNCVAFDHQYGDGSVTKGFDQNHNLSGVTIYNCTAWDNQTNYSFTETPNDGSHHVFKNNVGFNWTISNVATVSDSVQINNSWNLTVTANISDFLSLAPALAAAPRQADGSLPANDFARLAAGSDLIDQGVDVGLPYFGTAPDLGAFEFCPAP